MTRRINPKWNVTCWVIGYLAALLLGIELFLQNKGESFCKTATCDIIGDYTRFGETFILGAGVQFFLVTATLFFFIYKYRKTEITWLTTLVSLLLVGAMAFEGVLLGFQFFSLQSVCLLCAAVFGTIFVLLLLWSVALHSPRLLLFGIAVCCAGIAGMYTLNTAPGLGKSELGLDAVYKQAGFTDRQVQKRRLTLIISMTCPHCSTVVRQMALHKNLLSDDLLAFAFTDKKDQPLQAVGLFAANMARSDDILSFLYFVKTGQAGKNTAFHRPDDAVLDAVRKQSLHTGQFLRLLGLNGVPVLVADENSEQIRILVGAKAILEYLGIEMQQEE